MYKLTKRFNSRDGKLEVDSREYGMTQEGLNEIGDAKPHLGGATHIFAKTKGGPSNKINFFTRDNGISKDVEEKSHGWAEWFMQGGGSTYKPAKGESGWWNVKVADAPSEIAEGIGLPDSWHISTFVVFEWDADATGEIPEVPEEGEPEVPEEPDEETSRVLITMYGRTYEGHIKEVKANG